MNAAAASGDDSHVKTESVGILKSITDLFSWNTINTSRNSVNSEAAKPTESSIATSLSSQ